MNASTNGGLLLSQCRASNGKRERGAIARSLSGKVSTFQNFPSRAMKNLKQPVGVFDSIPSLPVGENEPAQS